MLLGLDDNKTGKRTHMALLTANNLTKLFGADEVFTGINLEINENARIALVGPNGVGKTTLLHILLELDSATDGTVQRKRGLTMGYLPQRPEMHGERTIWAEMMTAFTHLHQMEVRLKELEQALADSSYSEAEHAEFLERYGKLQHDFEYQGGFNYEIETRRVLHGLSFSSDDYDTPLSLLSGGQKTRAFLAKLLLDSPDLLILDEPTNHLDISAVEWLESYLKSWDGTVLLVSHDRYFMDKTVNIIWEMNFGEIEVYRGNYSHYLKQRAERHERRLKEFETQQAFIQKEQDYIDKNIAGQNTRQAQGRRKRLERMMSGTDRHGRAVDDPWLIRKPQSNQNFNMRLTAIRTGTNVFRTKGLTIGYEADEPIAEVPEIVLLRGETAAIIGPNGAGKSTFLKSILGQLEILDGKYEWGSKVKVGYFAQAHEELNADKTLLDEILDVKMMETSRVRSYLAQYLFGGDDVFRKVATLSGGERGRLALAKLALMGANVLLLDEPTNHLDIPSQEILEEVLRDFEGTILLVSHDRYIISALATQIWSIEQGEMQVFTGQYESFLAVRDGATLESVASTDKAEDASETLTHADSQPTHGLNRYQLQKELGKIEAKIHKLEAELESIMTELNTASEAGEIAKVTELGHRYADVEADLNAKMERWSELA